MRIIKFRAWDNQSKVMLSPSESYTGGSSRYEYMQYTGLKDKNGKDVYEGDIYIMPPFDDKSKRYEVKYEHSGFHLPDSEYMEVVGNIWES